MIRWSYLLPRLFILAALLIGLAFALDPLIRRGLISSGEVITGAKVEIGQADASLIKSEIRLRDVQVANPHEPMKNLFEAREIVLAMDGDSLLRKKFIVREARASGLRFGTDRATSGILKKSPPSPSSCDEASDSVGLRMAEYGQAWLEQFARYLEGEAARQIEQFRSVQLAREFVRRWPAEYERMEARTESMRRRGEQIRQFLGDDPRQALSRPQDLLRDPDAVRRAVGDVDQLLRETVEFREELERLGRQVRQDKISIEMARDDDLTTLRQWFRMDNLRPENLTEYLLGREWGERVVTLSRWVQWGRRHWPEKVSEPEPTRLKGVDVLFAGVSQRPGFLIQQLALDGEIEHDQERYQFEGVAKGLTAQPALYGKPMDFKVDLRGKLLMHIEGVVDRTQPAPREHLVIQCPVMAQPPRALGNPEQFVVVVSPGTTRLSVVLDLQGDDLTGRVTLKQEPIQLAPQFAPRCGGPRLAARLQGAFADIHTVEAAAELSGKLQKPEWKLQSTLGPQLASAINGLVQRELEARREQLTVLVQEQVDQQLAYFAKTLQEKEGVMLAKLQQSGDQIRQVHQLLADRMPRADDAIRRNLPAQMPFRF